MEKPIKLNNGNTVTIKEMRYIDSLAQNNDDRKEWFRSLLKNSISDPAPSDEYINSLSFRDGNLLVKEINILNGLTVDPDFPKPSVTESVK